MNRGVETWSFLQLTVVITTQTLKSIARALPAAAYPKTLAHADVRSAWDT
jgi:hypothetical protein